MPDEVFLSRFEDPREYLADVERDTHNAIDGTASMSPSEAAPIHAQAALAKAIAGLAAAIYSTRKGQ